MIATKDRAESLRGLFDALERQTMPRQSFEVVVVDDGSHDRTSDIIEQYRQRAAGPFTALRSPTSRGPAAARNQGIRAARGVVVAFTDDDCEPAADWLAAGVELLREGGHGVVMGATQPADPPRAAQPFARSMQADHEDGRYPTCNVFYSRAALERAGGFDQSFRFACGEDTDLAWRVKALGFTSAFCAEARVVHAVRAADFALFLRERRRFADQVLLVKRHPELRRLFYRRYFYRRSHVHVLASVLVVAAAVLIVWPIAALLVPVWFDRLRHVRLSASAPQRARIAAQIAIGDLWEFAVFCYSSARYGAMLI